MRYKFAVIALISPFAYAISDVQIQKCRKIDQLYNATMTYASIRGVGAISNYPIDQRKKLMERGMNNATRLAIEDITYNHEFNKGVETRTPRAGYEWINQKMTFNQLQGSYNKCIALFNK